MYRVIGEQSFADTDVSPETARTLLTDMVRARAFDEKALALQRRGWMSGYPPFKGQEGSQVAAAHAMADDDWLFPTYRSNAMQIVRDVPIRDILLFRRGHSEFQGDRPIPNFPQAVPIATQIPHAAGAGMAVNYTDADHGVLCYFGDGATSEGDFHEGLNFAGVFDAPVVFFCENNYWAISLPRKEQTASDTIAQKAEAYGFEGAQVDGNDPLAVYEAVETALSSAKDDGPVLLESLTHREGAHTTSDDPSVYRDEDDLDLPEWRTADPIDRYSEFLREEGVIEEGFVDEARAEAEEELDAAVEAAEQVEDPEPDEIFAHVYEEETSRVREERAALQSRLDSTEDR
jgi:pyruvate dehydrogenase E1 component alpha subunit